MNALNRALFCTCSNPTWIAGMVYVTQEDAESVNAERVANGIPPIKDEGCDKPYHPAVSFDPYA